MGLALRTHILFSITYWDVLWGVLGFIWSMVCAAFLSKKWYEFLVDRGVSRGKALYSSRKFIHIWAAGTITLATPYIFSGPLVPFVASIVLALITYIPHKRGELMDWFQTEENIDEVYFLLTWGATLLLLWLLLGDPRPAILPGAFLSIGDAVAGEVRNIAYDKRGKGILGNIAMAIVNGAIGFFYFEYIGLLAGLISAIVERSKILDDDVSVPISATIVIVLFASI